MTLQLNGEMLTPMILKQFLNREDSSYEMCLNV